MLSGPKRQAPPLWLNAESGAELMITRRDAIENDREPSGSGENSQKCLEIAIGLRESHRRGMTPVQLPLEDRTLKIIPPMSRWLNKKETMSLESYRESIGNWKTEAEAGS